MTTQHDERRKSKKLYVLYSVFAFIMICMLIFFGTGGRGVYSRRVTATIAIEGIQSNSDAEKVRSMLESLPEVRGLRIAQKAGRDEWIAEINLKVASETNWQDSTHSLVNVVQPSFKPRVISAAYVSFGIRRPGSGDYVFGRQEWKPDTD